MGDVNGAPQRRTKVAVIGSGLAGLSTAYLLVREGVEVWLIEKAPRLGFYSHSVELDQDSRPVSPTAERCAGLERRVSSTSSGRLSPVPPSEPMSRRVSAASSSGSSAPVSPGIGLGISGDGRGEKYGDVFLSALAPPRVSPPRRRPSQCGEDRVVDVPMRSFQGGYYPQLLALYKHLGFRLHPEAYTYAFSRLGGAAYFTYEGDSGRTFPSIPSAARRNPFALAAALLHLVLTGVCYVLFLGLAAASWHSLLPARLQKGSFESVVEAAAERIDRPLRPLPRTRLGGPFRRFVDELVIPLFSAVGTMTVQDVLESPAQPLLDYIHAGVGTAHFSLGPVSSRDVAMALSAPDDLRLRLGISVDSLRYHDGRLLLTVDSREEVFDRVVLATEASASLKLLESLEFDMTLAGRGKGRVRRIQKLRKEVRRKVHYRESIIVTHTDADAVMPPGDRRLINLVQPAESQGWTAQEKGAEKGLDAPHFAPAQGYVMATHSTRGVLQTTNPIVPIAPGSVLGVARMERALPFDSDGLLTLVTSRDATPSSSAHTYHAKCNGSASPSPDSTFGRASSLTRSGSYSRATGEPRRSGSSSSTDSEEGEEDLVHLVGSYVYPGIPLLEGCVGSARRVAKEILGHDPKIDWDAGRGGVLGRAWRWRRAPRVGGVL